MKKTKDEPIKSMDKYPPIEFITTGVPAIDEICGGSICYNRGKRLKQT